MPGGADIPNLPAQGPEIGKGVLERKRAGDFITEGDWNEHVDAINALGKQGLGNQQALLGKEHPPLLMATNDFDVSLRLMTAQMVTFVGDDQLINGTRAPVEAEPYVVGTQISGPSSNDKDLGEDKIAGESGASTSPTRKAGQTRRYLKPPFPIKAGDLGFPVYSGDAQPMFIPLRNDYANRIYRVDAAQEPAKNGILTCFLVDINNDITNPGPINKVESIYPETISQVDGTNPAVEVQFATMPSMRYRLGELVTPIPAFNSQGIQFVIPLWGEGFVKDPQEEPTDGGDAWVYSGEHQEEALLGTGWDRDNPKDDIGGMKITQCVGVSYYHDGDKKLYAYVRDYTYDSRGCLKEISGETRIEVEAPTDCTS